MELDTILPEIRFSAVRSRGPGGQNVNKVSSAAVLTWRFQDSPELSEFQKAMILNRLANSLNREGDLSVRSDEFRDLERNKARCLEKLSLLLQKAFHIPKARKPTRPTKASKEQRRRSKEKHSRNKSLRKKVL